MKKRLLSILLALVMVLGVVPTAALADAGYSDEELCSMAKQHYTEKYGSTPPLVEVDHTDGKYTVIHLYEVVTGSSSAMGHTATWGWYYIDRNTGKGYDFLTNDPIDLTPYAAGGELLEGSAEYEELRLFLHQFHFSWHDQTYDCRSISTQERNILQALIGNAICYAGPVPAMSQVYRETNWNGKDPLNKWTAYHKTGGSQIEWILKNVFNCTQSDVSRLQSSLGQSTWGEYYLDGYYYAEAGGIGDDFKETVITDITPDGNRYHVTYELHGIYGNDSLEGPYYAIVERKQIAGSGEGYWSLYYDSSDPWDEEYKVYRNDGYEVFDVSLEACMAKTPSTQYNPQLAHMLIAMCNSVFNSNEMTDTFNSFHFEKKHRYEGPFLTYSMAEKQTEEGDILLVVIRGSESIGDWGSNFDFAPNANGLHGGFADSANDLYDNVREFLGDGSDLSRTRFVITGFSRGAAVANILAARLVDEQIAQNSIYAYTFACPDVGKITSDTAGRYQCIFNVADINDMVSWVPSQVLSNDWYKYGRSYWFCHDWSDYKQISRNFGAHNQAAYMDFLRAEKNTAEYTGRDTAIRIVNDAAMRQAIPGSKANGPYLVIACPVDLEIYSSDNRLIGSIIDNTVNSVAEDKLVIRIFGEEKHIFFLDDDSFAVKFYGTGTGTMTYTVQNMNVGTWETLGSQTFTQVALADGKQFVSTVKVEENIAAEVNTKDVKLYVVSADGTPEKEVLPDGKGTEIPYVPKPSAVVFTDVPANTWYSDAVYWAVEQSITNGTGVNPATFSPLRDCKQVEILTFLWRANNEPSSSVRLPFTPKNSYAEGALRWAYEKGMIDAKFDENAPCTRATAVKFIWQAAGSPSASGSSFSDVPAGADYAQAVAWAVEEQITNGTGTNPPTFSPDDTCSRAEIVTFLYRDRAN